MSIELGDQEQTQLQRFLRLLADLTGPDQGSEDVKALCESRGILFKTSSDIGYNLVQYQGDVNDYSLFFAFMDQVIAEARDLMGVKPTRHRIEKRVPGAWDSASPTKFFEFVYQLSMPGSTLAQDFEQVFSSGHSDTHAQLTWLEAQLPDDPYHFPIAILDMIHGYDVSLGRERPSFEHCVDQAISAYEQEFQMA